nr:putative Ig domain-containing protein [Streptomyces sp. Ru62]
MAFPALSLTVAGFTAVPTAGAQPAATHPQTSKVTQNDKALTAPERQTYHSTGKAGQKVPTQHLCATAKPGQASCFAQRRTDIKQRLASALAAAVPSGLSPANLHRAYNLPTSAGSGMTVGVVDAYNDPNAESDLATYRSTYGLSSCTKTNGCFKQVSQTGSTTSLPTNDTGWAGAEMLDIDMVSAVCPNCDIILVEADSASMTDTGCSKRMEADVSAVADPATGVAVYDTYGGSGWAVYGGTSASLPIIASVYALAGTPGASDYPATYPYQHTSNLYDVTSGNDGSCSPSYFCTAGAGYDGPTGWGTPIGTAAFTSGSTGGNTVTVTNPGSQSATTGSSVSLQIKATDSGGAALTYSATGLPTGLSINSSTGLISGTASTAGTYQVTVTAKDSTGASGSTSSTWTVGSGGGGCASSQLLANPGFVSGSTGWSATSGVITNDTGEATHSGSYYAWLDGYGSSHTDTLFQSVTIPAGCKATLTFYLHIDTSETTSSTAYDKLTVTAGSTTLATYSNLNHNSRYTQKAFDPRSK